MYISGKTEQALFLNFFVIININRHFSIFFLFTPKGCVPSISYRSSNESGPLFVRVHTYFSKKFWQKPSCGGDRMTLKFLATKKHDVVNTRSF